MLVSITIPTLKSKEEIQPLISEITSVLCHNPGFNYEIISSCINQSAAKNRNWCIDNSKGDIIIQMDDDVHIIQNDWITKLIKPLIDNKEGISIIAPKLTDSQFKFVGQLGDGGWYDYSLNSGLKVAIHSPTTKLNIVCSACIAFFRDNQVRFDEGYPSAAYEDSDFCMETNKRYPDKKIVINLNSNLEHISECKWKKDNMHEHNRNYFSTKWGIQL